MYVCIYVCIYQGIGIEATSMPWYLCMYMYICMTYKCVYVCIMYVCSYVCMYVQ